MSLKAIDVYAGGGGLTVGLKRAGFEVVAAVEIEEHAYTTYRANHPEVHALKTGRDHRIGKRPARTDRREGDRLASRLPTLSRLH